VKAKLDNKKLYALVNNAGTGLAHKGVTPADMYATNFYGPKLMSEAFIPMIDPDVGRIVNLGSGAGPMYVNKLEGEAKTLLSSKDLTW